MLVVVAYLMLLRCFCFDRVHCRPRFLFPSAHLQSAAYFISYALTFIVLKTRDSNFVVVLAADSHDTNVEDAMFGNFN